MVVSVFSREWMTRVNFMEAQLSENVSSVPGPLPARMVNEFAYCPRLAYLDWVWVQGEWAESADTVDGQSRAVLGNSCRRQRRHCTFYVVRFHGENAVAQLKLG